LEVLPGIVRVRLVDTGLEQEVNADKLRRLPDKFFQLPAMAIKVGLAGIQPVQDTWQQQALEYVKEALLDKLMRMNVVEMEINKYMVVMEEDNNNALDLSINQRIVEKGYAVEVQVDEVVQSKAKDDDDLMSPTPCWAEGSRYSCRVVGTSSPDSVSLRRLDLEESFYKLNSEINNNKVGFSTGVSRVWEKGDSCVVKTPRDGWARARIDNITEADGGMVELLLYDYGSKFETAPNTLKPLPDVFRGAGAYSLTVQLPGLRPTGGGSTWASTTCEYLQELLEGAGMEVDIELGKRVSRDLWQADIFVREIDEDSGPLEPDQVKHKHVGEMLVERGLALPIGSSTKINTSGVTGDVDVEGAEVFGTSEEKVTSVERSSDAPVFRWGKPSLPKSERFVGNVSHVDWDCNLYLSSIEDNNEFLRVIGLMLENKYAGSSPSAHDLQWCPGEACVAQFSLDSKWYRGEVLEVLDMGCIVKFVDYGSEEWCECNKMRKGLFVTEYPLQCFTVKLEIEPITSVWERSVLDFIHKTVVDNLMEVTVLDARKEFPLLVKLVTVAGGIDIQALLVNNGYARHSCAS